MELDVFGRIAAEFAALAPVDLLTVFTLAMVEGILSVDNALVLAILVRELPCHQQKKALLYGIAGAFVFRALAVIFAAYLMDLWIFKLLGGGYLLYLSMRHMFFVSMEDAYHGPPKAQAGFWRTVVAVELTDIAFSIDSITAAVGMTDKLIIVWAGGILGIVFLRFAANMFITLLEKLPKMEDLAYQIVFFVGIKLTLETFKIEIGKETFWMVMGIIAILGASLVYKDWLERRTHQSLEGRLIEGLKDGTTTVADLTCHPFIPSGVLVWLVEKGFLLLPCKEAAQEVEKQPEPSTES
jgi:YkoY family integral membrane protein